MFEREQKKLSIIKREKVRFSTPIAERQKKFAETLRENFMKIKSHNKLKLKHRPQSG